MSVNLLQARLPSKLESQSKRDRSQLLVAVRQACRRAGSASSGYGKAQ